AAAGKRVGPRRRRSWPVGGIASGNSSNRKRCQLAPPTLRAKTAWTLFRLHTRNVDRRATAAKFARSSAAEFLRGARRESSPYNPTRSQVAGTRWRCFFASFLASKVPRLAVVASLRPETTFESRYCG